MRTLYILILAFILSLSSKAQTISVSEIETYDYDTTLKGGYSISFIIDDSLKYLFLKKGNKTITELASAPRGTLAKNLGYIGVDFKDYFVFVQSYGSGNPNYIQLIQKATGKNIIEQGSAWIDVDEKRGFLLYSENDVPRPKNKMTLYNVRTGEKEFFSFPTDIFGEPQILNRIQLHKLSEKQVVIKYETKKRIKKKVYSR